MSRPIAALNVPHRINDIIAFARFVATSMTDNPALPSPPLPLATFEADLAALDAAQAAVLTRTKGAAASRDDRLAVVRADLEYLRGGVQNAADENPIEAAAIIEGAGMSVKRPPIRYKNPLETRQGRVPGSADLVAKAVAKRASYQWEYSTDEASWVIEPQTLKANTVISGLAPGLRYFFRFRPVTKTGPGDFSQTVSLLVQ
jgi:hypothetical protein